MVSYSSHLMAPVILGFAVGSIAVTMVSAGAASPSAISRESPYLAENRDAMNKMMAGMTIRPSGNVDEDFATMMIPHHQGAIDMAKAELLHGHNEQLRRIAQEIVVEQQQEITAMRLALDQPLPPSAPAPDQSIARPTQTMNMKKVSP